MPVPIIDAHHHLWDPSRFDYPWMDDSMSVLRRPFEPDDLRPELERCGVSGTVLVQTLPSREETLVMLATAAATEFVVGVVGWVDLTSTDVVADIEMLRATPDGEWLVGIRHQVHDEADPGWLLRDDVQRGLEAVSSAGLAFDLLVRTRELPAAIQTAEDLPRLRLVLDHLAKPPIASGDLSDWGRQLTRLATSSNVCAKISGLVTEADWRTWSIDDLRRPIELAIDMFGPERLMLGSDWPVCLLAGSYADIIDSSRYLLADLTEHQRDAIRGGTAIRTYRLRTGQAA